MTIFGQFTSDSVQLWPIRSFHSLLKSVSIVLRVGPKLEANFIFHDKVIDMNSGKGEGNRHFGVKAGFF